MFTFYTYYYWRAYSDVQATVFACGLAVALTRVPRGFQPVTTILASSHLSLQEVWRTQTPLPWS